MHFIGNIWIGSQLDRFLARSQIIGDHVVNLFGRFTFIIRRRDEDGEEFSHTHDQQNQFLQLSRYVRTKTTPFTVWSSAEGKVLD